MMSDIEQHDLEWNDQLQDLLDGDVTGGERAALETHVAGCARCRAQFAKLKKLDALLHAKIDAPAPSASFDQQVFARINAFDTHARERARRRIDRELKDNLEMLSRGWRRGLISTLAGAVAGLAVAVALITWADQSGAANAAISAVGNGFGNDTNFIHTVVTMLIGAGIGAIVSRWLTAAVE
jgi:anti-sigma factor RsiW